MTDSDAPDNPQQWRVVDTWRHISDDDRTAIKCLTVERWNDYGQSKVSLPGRASDFAYYCGYAKLPEVLWGVYDTYVDLNDDGIHAYGGLTYGPDDRHYIGFDTNHGYSDPWTPDKVAKETDMLAAQLVALAKRERADAN